MPGEQGCAATRFGSDGLEGGARQAIGVLGEPELVLPRRGDEPLEEVHAQPSAEAMADDADLGQEVPDVGSLERGRHDEEHRSIALLPVVVGSQLGPGKLCDHAGRRLPRPEADGVEPPAELPAHLVNPIRHRICPEQVTLRGLPPDARFNRRSRCPLKT